MKYIFIIFFVLSLFSCRRGQSVNIETNENAETREIYQSSTFSYTLGTIPHATFDPNSTDLNYLLRNMREYFKTIETPNIDFSLIHVTNCLETTDFFLPDISYMIFERGLGSELPSSLITENFLSRTWHNSLYINLKTETDIEQNITLIARNGIREYEYPRRIQFRRNYQYRALDEGGFVQDVFVGFYYMFLFEHKPWFNEYANENTWNIIVKSDTEELLDENIDFNFSYFLYKEIDSSPFVRNGLSVVDINNEYTYRFITQDVDIIVIYYSFPAGLLPYFIFRPVLYLIPNESIENYSYITISWTDEQLRGVYHIRNYKLNNLPQDLQNMEIPGRNIHVR